MIFCKRCGRYFSDGTASCGACGANLGKFGETCFQGRSIKVEDFSQPPASAPAPERAPRRESAALAVLEPPDPTLGIDEPVEPVVPVEPLTDPVFDRDRFLLRQKALAIKEKYYVTDEHGANLLFVERPALLTQQVLMLAAVAATFFGGNFAFGFLAGLLGTMLGATFGQIVSLAGFLAVLALTLLVFVRLVPKRHVTFYRDDSKSEKVLEITQLNKVEFPFANFTVCDADGNFIGSLRKNVLFDYVRRRW